MSEMWIYRRMNSVRLICQLRTILGGVAVNDYARILECGGIKNKSADHHML